MGISIEPRMEGMGIKALPWRRYSGPVRRTANSETPICSLGPLHHGEAGAARPSSDEAFLPPLSLSIKGALREMRNKRSLAGSDFGRGPVRAKV